MTETTYLLWLLLIPLLLSLLAFVARWFGALTRIIVVLAHLVSVTLVLVLSVLTVQAVLGSGRVFGFSGWLHVDALGAVFLLITGVVSFLIGLYSIGYTDQQLRTGGFDSRKLSTYYGLFNLFLFTMLLLVTSNNIIMMWVAMEAGTLGSAFMVGVHGDRASLEAAWKYLVICLVGEAFGLYGTVLVYSAAFNTLQVPANAVLWTEILKNAQALDPAMIKIAFVFVLVGFGTKAGLFPMHAWLPDTYSEAPSPVSAMLSAVFATCALLVIFRFSVITSIVLGPSFVQILFLVFGTISVAAASFFMYVQHDVKRLLAYSSIENIGFILVAFGLGGPAGIFAGLLQTINQSLVKSLLWCASGNIFIKYRARNLERVKGILQAIPATGVLLIVGALAVVGSPPFNIFLSKFLIVTAGLAAGYTWLMIVCLLLLLVVFAAFFRFIASMLFGEKPQDVAAGESNWLTLLPGGVLILLILGLGLFIPSPLTALLRGASGLLLTGNAGGQIAVTDVKDFLLPLARLLR
ncbi:MAG TPA: hydrogenase 4 subunit F [Anaerolineales bacterium]|nr:hydrogenase 4 subunit F [Anaerolineales bacterium]